MSKSKTVTDFLLDMTKDLSTCYKVYWTKDENDPDIHGAYFNGKGGIVFKDTITAMTVANYILISKVLNIVSDVNHKCNVTFQLVGVNNGPFKSLDMTIEYPDSDGSKTRHLCFDYDDLADSSETLFGQLKGMLQGTTDDVTNPPAREHLDQFGNVISRQINVNEFGDVIAATSNSFSEALGPTAKLETVLDKVNNILTYQVTDVNETIGDIYLDSRVNTFIVVYKSGKYLDILVDPSLEISYLVSAILKEIVGP